MINCQSIKGYGKQGLLENIMYSTQADIVIGTESWLDSSVKSSEVFPPHFKSYRRDRSDGKGGGVFILVSDSYDSCEPEELTVDQDCELVWAKVKVKGVSDLYVGSLYKPPSTTDPEYLNPYNATFPGSLQVHTFGLEETSTCQILTGKLNVYLLMLLTMHSATNC